MRNLLTITRLTVGVLFIFSGLVKANDPAGLGYKMQEFFEAWGMHAPDSVTLPFSIAMIAFEIMAGVAVILGWRFSAFAWLLMALIVFFTFLTGYALFSGKIRQCGCFGDCIPLTSGQSFVKDLLLLVMIGFLFLQRDRVKPLFRESTSMTWFILSGIASIALMAYALTRLPPIDCLPYKVGGNIPEKMRIPPGAIPDSTVINFVYEKDGRQVEFDANNFPADFNDSAYRFVRRYDKLVRKGNAEPAIKDFVILTQSGTDTTQAILSAEGRVALVFSRSIDGGPEDWTWRDELSRLKEKASKAGVPLIWVTSDAERLAAALESGGWGDIPVLKGDAVAIKTAARADPTVYIIRKGTIEGKWSYADFDDATAALEDKSSEKP
jgi:uncharacterized membrane protein YphA (DoxX/SURF4 family)